MDTETQELMNEFHEIRNKIDEVNLPPSIRSFINRQFDLIHRAIFFYPINGTQPLRDAIEQSLGAATSLPTSVIEEMKDLSEEQKPIMAKAWGILQKVGGIVDNARSWEQRLAFGSRLFEKGKDLLPYLDRFLN